MHPLNYQLSKSVLPSSELDFVQFALSNSNFTEMLRVAR